MVIALFHVNVFHPTLHTLSGYHVSTLCHDGVRLQSRIFLYALITAPNFAPSLRDERTHKSLSKQKSIKGK